MKETWKDDYFEGFSTGGYADLKLAQAELERKSEWETVNSEMSVAVLAPDRMYLELKANDPTNPFDKELLVDTFDSTNLTLRFGGKETLLRSCAIKSLQDTAAINGDGLKRVDKENYAVAMSAVLTACRKNSQVLSRAGKVAAIVSSHYQYMPVTELLEITEGLEATFGEAEFVSGSVSHDLTTAQFRFPKSVKSITAAYNSVLVNAGRSPTSAIMPIVQFRASDTSNEAAKLNTYLRLDGAHTIPLGGIKVNHIAPQEYDENGVRLTCIEKFRQEASTLFAKMEYDIVDLLPKMLDTAIEHPGNCLVGLCKYAGIPQKWGGIIEEEFRFDWPDGSDCTFLDVYEALTKATSLAITDGFKPYSKRVLDLEEGISKISRNRASWKRFDLPGTVAWTQKT